MAMRKSLAHKTAKAQKTKTKLVGYWEDRTLAEKIHAALKKRGEETSEFLRRAYRSVLEDPNANAVEWTLKESVIARRLDISKSTLKAMRDRKELVDARGPIWHRRKGSKLVMYDVDRTKAFFLERQHSNGDSV